MELITPMEHPDKSGTTAKVLAYYDHPTWGKYAAITQNTYGKGVATYIGCMTSAALTEKILKQTLEKANVWGLHNQLHFPLITKTGVNQKGKTIHYYFNYSANPNTVIYPHKNAKELLSNSTVAQNTTINLGAWDVKIIEED